MRTTVRLALAGAAALAATALFATPALASPPPDFNAPVFVQTDNLSGNAVVAYDRTADGTLHPAGTYATGGLGGALTGSVVDHLASQGSLTYDRGLLYAVNAGSNTITVFAVRGDRLLRVEVLPSGGDFPVSVTAHGNLVYVLNARSGGAVQGYVRVGALLVRIPLWNRALGLNASQTPEFTSTPGQVAFTPDGSKLIVTTKGNGSSIDVFGVNRLGGPSSQPVKNAEPGAVPFAVSFDAHGNLVVAEAGTNALATFSIRPDGTLAAVAQLATGQAATCWVAGRGSTFFASNAGSASLTGARDPGNGQLATIGNTSTDPGTVDASITPDGRFLYVQTGANGIVDEFRINANGTLTELGSVVVPGGVGGEGIAAL